MSEPNFFYKYLQIFLDGSLKNVFYRDAYILCMLMVNKTWWICHKSYPSFDCVCKIYVLFFKK